VGRYSGVNLIALGISHNSAAVEVLSGSFAPGRLIEALMDACERPGWMSRHLSTCNRTELYAMCQRVAAWVTRPWVIDWIANYHHLSARELRLCAYHHEGGQALRHLVQVASGLDSMVLGEPQIFGQLKSAYVVATEAGTVGSELGRLFPRIFSAKGAH
jgi:glutamyl-tRNA reductase